MRVGFKSSAKKKKEKININIPLHIKEM